MLTFLKTKFRLYKIVLELLNCLDLIQTLMTTVMFDNRYSVEFTQNIKQQFFVEK